MNKFFTTVLQIMKRNAARCSAMLRRNFLKPGVVRGTAGGFVLAGLLALAMLQPFACAGGPATNENTGPVFNWNNRLQLSDEQYELIHLYSQLENADAEKKQALNEQVTNLVKKLGANAVRRARAHELVATRTGTNVVNIYNPSRENLAFTVSVKNDTEWNGSRKSSVGRDTYLPANGTLTVTNIYWTTPSMGTPKKE